ncbi:MAG: ATP-binding cassette domain-containing protein [Desulfobacterales bacterium]|nr:ATP-binding cassette domain-containing protein [Desulfobacterales bacterium]
MKQPLIEFKNVSKSFGANHVLRGASFRVFPGEVTTLIGKSGSGKSVMLRLIIGLLAPDSGEILFDGRPLAGMNKQERKAFKRKFSYMFQGSALFDSMTVFENIALPLMERTTLPKAEIQRRVRDKMRQLDLHQIEDKNPAVLSGGMKKRVALARALVTDPEIVLFDEPTTGLDPIRKNAVHSLISDYQKRYRFTSVVVSHEIPDVFYISQHIAMIDQGRILFEGSPEEIQNVTDANIQSFIRGMESRRDELTGLSHRRQGERRFSQEIARLKRHNSAFSLVLLVFENLPEINAKMGHEAGQTVLKEFAIGLQKHLRVTDTCSRYGMDKILMLLPDTTREQAHMVCSKLTHEFRRTEIAPSRSLESLCFVVRAGFAEAMQDNRIEDVLERAETAPDTIFEFRIC